MATKFQEERAAREREVLARVHARAPSIDQDPAITSASGETTLNPDAAFAGDTQPASAEQLQEFNALPPAEEAPFSRQGRDYYVDPSGGLHSVEAGFDAATQYPGLKPATAEQVHARDIQKRSGSLADRFDTAVESGVATVAETGAGINNALNNLTHRWPDPSENVNPEDLAPFAFTDPALERREANPKSALAGAIVPDLLTMAIAPEGGGVAAGTRRALLAGALGAGADATLTGEPYSVSKAGLYGIQAGLLDGVSRFAWGEAMRSLGKKASVVDEALENAQRAAATDAVRETDPARRAAELRRNAPHLYEQAQGSLDQALEKIDEHVQKAPERLFTPGALRQTVSDNVTAQAADVTEIARKLSNAAEVTGQLRAQQAAEALLGATGENGPGLFAAMRQARQILREVSEAGEATPLLGKAPHSPLIEEASQALDDSLKNEAVWGRAAKNHATFGDPIEPTAPGGFDVSDVNAREALDTKLADARRVAQATGNKPLLAAIRKAEKAIVDADQVTGARLMGPELPEVQPPTLGQKIVKKTAGRAMSHLGKIVGGIGGGMIGGVPGAIGGTVLGDVLGEVAGPHIERAAERLAGIGRRSAPAHAALGERWTNRIYSWAKGAAKRNPTKIAGAGLLAASALSDDSDDSTAAANAGLLVFFLPSGGKAQLAEQLGERLAALTSKERSAIQRVAKSTSPQVEEMLYQYARGRRGFPGVPGERVTDPSQILEMQHEVRMQAYARDHAIIGSDAASEIPAPVQTALLEDLYARNAALIENDGFLYRMARPGRLDVVASAERTPAEALDHRLAAAKKAFDPINLPSAVHDQMILRVNDMGEGYNLTAHPDTAARTAGQATDDVVNYWERNAQRLGSKPTAKAIEYIDAEIARAAERTRTRFADEAATARREQMRAVGPDDPPPSLRDRARSQFENQRLRMEDTINAAERGDVPSREMLDQNPRRYFEEWQQNAVVTGAQHDVAARQWVERHLVAPVYEALGREPTVGENLPRVTRQLARDFGDRVRAGDRASAERLFDTWKGDTELRVSRQLTPEELAWGHEQIVEARPQLRALSGEGQGVRGAGPEFRRLGLPEPTQGDVRIETPMQQKAFPFKREMGQTPRIEGEPIRGVGDPLFQQRAQRAYDRVSALPEEAFSVEAQTEYRRYQRYIQQGDYRLHTDREIEQMARGTAETVSRENVAQTGQPLSPDVQEFIQAHMERDMRQRRASQLLAQPLNADERAQRAFNVLREDDMPARLQSMHGDVRERVTNQIRHDSTPEEIQGHIRSGLDEMKHRFIVEANRPPNARERAYLEADLANEAGSRFEREQNNQQQLERREREASERAERISREVAERVARQQREAQRVADLMGAFDLPEDRQDELGRWMDAGKEAARASPETEGRSVFRDDVLAHVRQAHPELTDAEEVFLRDQLNEPTPPVEQWARDAVDELARNDESHWSDGRIPDLDFDDVVREIERSEGKLDPWQEYHLRKLWEDEGARFEQQHREYIEERHSLDKQEYEAEQEREREREEEERVYSSGSYDDAVGLPDVSDLRDIGLDNVNVEDPHGIERVFKQDLSLKDVEDLCALEPLADLGATTTLNVNRGAVEFEARGGGVTIDRTYTRDGGDLIVQHDQFFLEGSEQAQGIMKKVFQKMFPAYERLGFKRASVSSVDIGRYLWPSLGFRASPEIEREAIDAFLRGPWHDYTGLSLPTSEVERLGGSLHTLRDLADATVPRHVVEHALPALEERYKTAMRRGAGDFEKLFFTKDNDFKIGKLFLITSPGDWNRGLKLRIDPADPWYREFRRRIGLMSLSGLGLTELARAFSEDPHRLSRTEGDAEEATPAPQALLSDTEREAQDSTRQKLDYLHSQAKSAVTTTARALVIPAAQKSRTVPVTPGVTQSAGVASFVGAQATLRAAYDAKKTTLQKLQRDPMSLVDEMAERLGDVSDAAPELHRQLVAQTYKVIGFLQSKLPTTIGASLIRPDGTPPSDTALRQFALYYSAATNPSSVHVDLANNRARKEQVDTLRELWPEAYQDLKVAVLNQLADQGPTSSRPTLAQRTRLDLLFDFGPSLDRALSDRIVQARMAYLEEKAKTPQPGGTPDRRTQPSIVGASPTARLSMGTAAA